MKTELTTIVSAQWERFFLIGMHSKAEQSLRGMELQNEAQKD